MAGRTTEAFGWLAGATAAFSLAWMTATATPAIESVPSPPAPLARPPTDAEAANVQALAADVLRELSASIERTGVAPTLQTLEAMAPDGKPFLPTGLPDNPLSPGVAGVVNGCPDTTNSPATADWAYCPAPLLFHPAHLGAGAPQRTQSGNP